MFKPEVYEWGISVIRAVQVVSHPSFTAAMKMLTHIGSPAVAVLIILFVLWCVDFKTGFKLFFLTFIAFALNICLKNVLGVPRPFVLDPVIGLIAETGFSTPSGHAQGAAVFWTLFAWCCLQNRKKTKIALALCIPFVVSFTRVYLGVHYPTDVLLGMAAGYLCALGGILFYEGAAQKIRPLKRAYKLLALALLCLLANHFSGGGVSASAALFGFTLGYIFLTEKKSSEHDAEAHGEKTVEPKSADAPRGTRIFVAAARFCLGGFLCGAVYIALKIPAGLLSAYEQLVDFARYAAVGFTASNLAPRCFEKFLTRVSRP